MRCSPLFTIFARLSPSSCNCRSPLLASYLMRYLCRSCLRMIRPCDGTPCRHREWCIIRELSPRFGCVSFAFRCLPDVVRNYNFLYDNMACWPVFVNDFFTLWLVYATTRAYSFPSGVSCLSRVWRVCMCVCACLVFQGGFNIRGRQAGKGAKRGQPPVPDDGLQSGHAVRRKTGETKATANSKTNNLTDCHT